MNVRREIKRFKNRVYDLEKSRDYWKQRSNAQSEEIDALHGELEQLKWRLEEMSADGELKKSLSMASGPGH
jgi:hypothetical protein